ncbi:hypothetical protein MBGDN05_00409 [Thermoplasmatales archaeon SCGC AB-539-N05]|nr:hypothetical protein MBGDN05_00409 [Thermoplasmatales archaeon SCGC AB-539-N05]ENO11877.1 hypothetical protein MBGDC06_00439 [Thermoplasmatales archaeon SCGC AB-539-C06]
MKKEKIRNELKECFRKCAFGRKQLRKCVTNAMNVGLTKEEILAITSKRGSGVRQYEASLCSIVAASQLFRYEKEHRHVKAKSVSLADDEKEEITNKLRNCFRKCVLAKSQLKKCIGNAMDLGLTHDEVLAITDDVVGGLGEEQVSLCAIVALNHALSREENKRKAPIDIIEERRCERGDTT